MPHRNCGVLGIGYTRRSLPLVEIISEPIDLSTISKLTDPKPSIRPAAQARELDDEHFIGVDGRVCHLGPKFGCAGSRSA